MATPKILVIGAGELGNEVLRSLIQHPHRDATVAVLLRPSSIASTNSSKQKELQFLKNPGVELVPGDVVQDEEPALASTFAGYDMIIGCTGFVAGKGTQIKIASAVLAA
jgi:molybdopterin/thiamine biosynthesis adenylyltransferase